MVALDLPYIPGFLAFREAPFLLKLLDRLRTSRPDLMPQVERVGHRKCHPEIAEILIHPGLCKFYLHHVARFCLLMATAFFTLVASDWGAILACLQIFPRL